MRHATYPASATVRDELQLRGPLDVAGTTPQQALAAWHDYLGRDVPVLLVKNVDRARKLLMAVFEIEEYRTVVLVLQVLDPACRYADHLVTMKEGRVVAVETPREVVSEALVRDVFDVSSRIVPDPLTGSPIVLTLPAEVAITMAH